MKKKRIDNIYYEPITYNNLYKIWKVVKKTCKNKRKVFEFQVNLECNLNNIYKRLISFNYKPSKFTIFMIYEPKPRLVMSSSITDKIVNHFFVEYYLLPYLESSLMNLNVATRKNKGSSYARYLIIKYINGIIINERPEKIYCLKLDISKYFYNINHDILINMISKKIMDNNVINLIKIIISETNKDYVNESVDYYNNKYNCDIPYYKNNKGLSIGAVTSQFLAIFYLNEIDHFIVEKLGINNYCRYMDDLVIFDTNKEYLVNIWKKIELEINKLDLSLNKKSNIYLLNKGINFLGFNYKYINNKLKLSFKKENYRRINKRLNYLKIHNLIYYFKSLASFNGYYMVVKKKY